MKTRKLLLILVIPLFFSCEAEKKDFTLNQNNLRILAEKINNDFLRIHEAADTLAESVEFMHQNKDSVIATIDTSAYEIEESTGVFYRKNINNGSAVFVSGAFPITNRVKNETYLTEPLDDLFKEIASFPSVIQVYYNDRFSGNRIYPAFDVLSQYEPGLVIPEYNFYYLADEEHNPEKKSLWLDELYVDPAGRGWMISALAPVYHKDTLMGVVGIDITVKTIIKQYLPKNDKNTIIVDSDGKLIAASPEALFLFGMPSLKNYQYTSTIKEEEILGEDFNILKSKNASLRRAVEELLNEKSENVPQFQRADTQYGLLSAPIAEFGWYIVQATEQG